MTDQWQRFAAIVALLILGAGIIGFMTFAISADGKLNANDGGWLAAGFLSLREVMSKIENIVLGVKTPPVPEKD